VRGNVESGSERPEGAASRPTHAASRYLEAIYYILHEGLAVRPGRLAEWLGVSAPTVTVSLQRLARDGLVAIAGDRSVSFTELGELQAAAVVRRHRVVECWLTDQLGLDWVTADSEAEQVAHVLSDVVLDRLYDRLGQPETCPHGNEIPGREMRQPAAELISLEGLHPGSRARVTRISELAEHEAPEVLSLLDSEGLVPGAAVAVEEAGGDPGVLHVRVGDRELVHISAQTARAVWVEVLPAAV
jgi:DtxR family Mn-dependent transcriptional regulator